MKSLLWIFAIALSGPLAQAAPQSGFLREVFSETDENGRATEKSSTKTWFSGPNTRIETWNNGQLAGLNIYGETSKTFYWKAQRYMDTPVWLREKMSYPEQVVANPSIPAGVAPEKTTLKGMNCWRYSWHQPEQPVVGDMSGGLAFDATFWVYADESFPLVLKSQSSFGDQSEIVELKLDIPVPASTFSEPGDFKRILPFRLPANSFELETQEATVSTLNPAEKSLVTESYFGAGEELIREHSRVTDHGDGRQTVFHGGKEVFQNVKWGILNQMLTVSLWGDLKKVGEENLPLGPADIFENLEPSSYRERLWIIDDPIWGSIVAQRVQESKWSTVTWRLARIESNVAPAT